MVPTVFLRMVPTELDIEVESEAEYHAALSKVKEGFIFDFDGSVSLPPGMPDMTVPNEVVPPAVPYHGDRGPAVPSIFETLDEMVKRGEHSQPIILRQTGDAVSIGTLEDFESKMKSPGPHG